MGRVAAGVRAQGKRMLIPGQEFQVSSVGVVHQQRDAVPAGDRGDRPQIRHLQQRMEDLMTLLTALPPGQVKQLLKNETCAAILTKYGIGGTA